MAKANLPSAKDLLNPLLEAVKQLGGSGTIEEINTRVAENLQLPDDQLDIPHNPANDTRTEFEYRMAWARTTLKLAGLLDNSTRGVWSLTATGVKAGRLQPSEISKAIRVHKKKVGRSESTSQAAPLLTDYWETQLREELLTLSPAGFERLVQRFLRESGFVQVEVTGRASDGGIDGKGILRLGGVLSFHVIFQCKRWKGSVGAAIVRDFRGAMVGRADKGLLITTGTFTKDGVREATRDGAPAIDLIDGETFVQSLKSLSLGVITRKVEREEVEIDKDWFKSI